MCAAAKALTPERRGDPLAGCQTEPILEQSRLLRDTLSANFRIQAGSEQVLSTTVSGFALTLQGRQGDQAADFTMLAMRPTCVVHIERGTASLQQNTCSPTLTHVELSVAR